MQKSLRKLLVFGKELSIFTGILLVLFFVFSCNNMINIRGGGNLIIAIPGARAATASSFTIELTGSNGATQNKTVSGGSTIQFDDLAPDTYTISVKGMDDAGTVVFSGSAKATVVAGKTATVTVDLQELLGSLTVEFTVPAESTATSFTVEVSDSKDFSESKTVSDGTSVLFNDLIPGSYTISVQGMNASTVVLSGSATGNVVAGDTDSVRVNLEVSPGSLTVIFSEPSGSTATSFTVEITDSEGKTISDGSSSQFDNLAPGTYHIVVEGIDTNNKVVVGGAYSATVTAGATASAPVNLVEGVSDYDSLQKAVGNGGTVNILKSIDVPSSLTVGTNVTIQAAYQDVSLKNISSGNLFIIDNSSGNLTIGGGKYTITLDGGEVAKSIIHMTAGTATLRDKGIIRNAKESGVLISSGTFNMTGGSITGNIGSSGGGVNLSSARFNMTGGSISGNTVTGFGGAVSMSSGTFSMTGGSIDNNSSDNNGGGVSVSGGEFKLSGGSITGNSAKNDGDGVYMSSGTFNMSGSAVVDEKNDVYLYYSNPYFNKITITGELTGATPVATITSSSYTSGTQVLQGGDGVDLVAEVSKFAVTPNDAGEWAINTDGTLKQVQ